MRRTLIGQGRAIPAALQDWISIFLGILVEATPFLLLGVGVSSLVHVFVSEDRLLRMVPRNPILAIVPALCVGMLMPVCECGNVAVARRFLAKGVPVSSCVAFLLAAPVLNPVSLFATATAFHSYLPSMVWLRGGLTFFIAAAVGILVGQWSKAEQVIVPALVSAHTAPRHEHTHHEVAHNSHDHGHGHGHSGFSGWSRVPAQLTEAVNHAGGEFLGMMQVLVFGATVAAATQVLIPRATITGMGEGAVLGIVAMMSLAFVLSICSTVDAFFALSYAGLFPSPALLAFLVLGPMMSIKGIPLLLTAFRPKVVFALATVTVELIFVATLLLNLKGVLL